MKKVIGTICFALLFSLSFSQTPHWKKQIISGSVMTGIGAGMIAGGSYCIPLGIFFLTDDEPAIGAALTGGGAALLAGGIVLDVLGPIKLAKGIKEKKTGSAYLNFTSNSPALINRYQPSFTKNRIAALTLTF